MRAANRLWVKLNVRNRSAAYRSSRNHIASASNELHDTQRKGGNEAAKEIDEDEVEDDINTRNIHVNMI